MCFIGCNAINFKLANKNDKNDITYGDGSVIIDDMEIAGNNIMKKLHTIDFPEYFKLNNLYFIEPKISSTPPTHLPAIYTDGCKSPWCVSAAYSVPVNNTFTIDYSNKLNQQNSIYQAELLAILFAIKWFRQSTFNSIYLHTDSESSVKALQRLFPTNSIISEIFNLLIHTKPSL